MADAVGGAEVAHFCAEHFIGRWPADTAITSLSRTQAEHHVVDEMIKTYP